MKPSELIRQKGWCQGALAQSVSANGGWFKVRPRIADHINRFSAVGAIRATKGVGNKQQVIEMAKVILLDRGITGRVIKNKSSAWLIIQAWNNESGRTVEEVIAKLEEFGL